jgi:pantoate--beta-alanine ligase
VPDVITTLARWRAQLDGVRASGASIGLTMTMGALHAGHTSLFERAATECDVAVATIFVNPLQFNDAADFERYDVDLDADLALAGAAGVSMVLAPSTAEMWPRWPQSTSTVHVPGLADRFEGADRPGHFDGVAAVVAKVLGRTGQCTAYFGEKDFQQLCVVRRMVDDLALDVEVVGCPTVREHDGLALSSRNAALVLSRALRAGADALEGGQPVADAEQVMRSVVSDEPLVALAYASVVDPATLASPSHVAVGMCVRLLIAGVVDGVRLIDNVEAVVGAAR